MNAWPPVQFLLPSDQADFDRLPRRLDGYVAWQQAETSLSPFLGRFHWVLQTYLQLREANAPVSLVRELPQEGIVISHIECLDYGLKPNDQTLLVPMLVDKDVPLPHAALHITHNPVQGLPLGMRRRFMMPWPQIGLLPRNAERGERFESVGFFGHAGNLHPALASQAFADQLASMGLQLVLPAPSSWHDFSAVDVVLAVRNFGRGEKHLTKPSLKLYNAWQAGVPAVLGFETAYRNEAAPGEDYLEATNADEVLAALRRLAADPALRARMVAAGRQRMQSRSEPMLRAAWLHFLQAELLPLYQRRRSSWWFRTQEIGRAHV
jgi:hypothetical protein